MNRLLLVVLVTLGTAAGLSAQEPDSLRRDTIPKVTDPAPVQDSLVRRASPGQRDSLTIAADTTETRRERRRRERQEREAQEAKEVVFKDSARLAIEELSRKAWKRSLMVPGWGQITNGGWWWLKVPVIYGGFVSAALVFEFNNRYYREILSEVQYRVENNHAQPPNTKYPAFPAESWATDRLINAKDYYRRNRDLTVLVTMGWWGIQVVEAYVTSILKYRWDIGDDLGINVAPTLLSQPAGTFAYRQEPYTFGVKVGIRF